MQEMPSQMRDCVQKLAEPPLPRTLTPPLPDSWLDSLMLWQHGPGSKSQRGIRSPRKSCPCESSHLCASYPEALPVRCELLGSLLSPPASGFFGAEWGCVQKSDGGKPTQSKSISIRLTNVHTKPLLAPETPPTGSCTYSGYSAVGLL